MSEGMGGWLVKGRDRYSPRRRKGGKRRERETACGRAQGRSGLAHPLVVEQGRELCVRAKPPGRGAVAPDAPHRSIRHAHPMGPERVPPLPPSLAGSQAVQPVGWSESASDGGARRGRT